MRAFISCCLLGSAMLSIIAFMLGSDDSSLLPICSAILANSGFSNMP